MAKQIHRTKNLPKYDIENMYGIDCKEVIRKMLMGVDIAFVDPAIFPQLPPYINEMIESHKESHDIAVVHKLEFYKKYISEYPKRQAASALISRPIAPPPVIPPALSQEEVITEIDRLFSTGEIKKYPEDQLDLIVAGLRQRRAELISKGDYLGAQKANYYSEVLITFGQLTTVENIQKSKVTILEEKVNAAREDLENSKKKWEEFYQNARDQQAKEIQKILDAASEENSALEAQKSPDYEIPLSIRKYSQKLLDLKQRYESCIATKDYSQAADLNTRINELQEIEEQKMKENWNAEIDVKIKNAKANQERQLAARKAHFRAEEVELVKQANKDVQQQELALKHLERNLELAKNAMNTAKTLRKDSQQINRKSSLPPLSEMSPKKKAETRQRQILNAQIYTKSPSKNGNSPKSKNLC